MSYKDLVRFYGKNYHGWVPMLDLWEKGRDHWIQDTKNYEKYLHKGSILILGCGVGGQVWGWQQREGWFAHGYEISEWAVENAITDNIHQGDIKDMTIFGDKQFDNVLAFDILEHVPIDTLPVSIGECARITKRIFLVRVPFWYNQPRWAYRADEVFMEHMINQDSRWWEAELSKILKPEIWTLSTQNIEKTEWTLFRYKRKDKK